MRMISHRQIEVEVSMSSISERVTYPSKTDANLIRYSDGPSATFRLIPSTCVQVLRRTTIYFDANIYCLFRWRGSHLCMRIKLQAGHGSPARFQSLL
jgi:hypothetical protein